MPSLATVPFLFKAANNQFPTKSDWAGYALQALGGKLSEGNKLARNSSGNAPLHSSQLAEPLWTDPGLINPKRPGQRKRWEDNIREWTGLEFGKSQRAVENREKWRKLVAKSSVCPNDPRG